MPDLTSLLERVRAASGPDRELDRDIVVGRLAELISARLNLLDVRPWAVVMELAEEIYDIFAVKAPHSDAEGLR